MKRQAGGDVHNVVTGTVRGDVAQAGRDIRRSHDDPDAPAAAVGLRAALAGAIGIITRWLTL